VNGSPVKRPESARFGQSVTVQVMLGELRSRGLRFEYKVLEAAGRTVLVEGYTRHVCIDHSGQVMRIPAELLARLQR
jgi:acyl-CoA thioester hydrolase